MAPQTQRSTPRILWLRPRMLPYPPGATTPNTDAAAGPTTHLPASKPHQPKSPAHTAKADAQHAIDPAHRAASANAQVATHHPAPKARTASAVRNAAASEMVILDVSGSASRANRVGDRVRMGVDGVMSGGVVVKVVVEVGMGMGMGVRMSVSVGARWGIWGGMGMLRDGGRMAV